MALNPQRLPMVSPTKWSRPRNKLLGNLKLLLSRWTAVKNIYLLCSCGLGGVCLRCLDIPSCFGLKRWLESRTRRYVLLMSLLLCCVNGSIVPLSRTSSLLSTSIPSQDIVLLPVSFLLTIFNNTL